MPTDERTPAEGRGSSEGRSGRRAAQRYRRLTIVVVASLALLGGVLGAANTLQGPRLTSGEINGQGAVGRPGQRLVLHANQPIAHVDASQVTVTPTVPFTATTSGSDLTLTLDGMLDYETDYTVTVAAKSLYSGAAASLDYSFTTPDIPIYTLIRDTGSVAGDEPDRVVRASLSGDAPAEDVFTAPRIQEYAVSGSMLAAIVLDDQNTTSLVVRDLSTGVDTEVAAGAATGAMRYLKSSGASGLFGFTVTGESAPDGSTSPTTLYVYDPASDGATARQVKGFDGAQLPAVAWTFVQGTTSAVIQDYDQQLFLIDVTTDSVPSPLGRHAEVHGFIPGTAQLVVSDLQDFTRIDLQAAKTESFDSLTAQADPSYYPGKRLYLDGQGRFVQEFDVPDAQHQYSTSVLMLIDETGTRQIFRPDAGTRIRNICLSPNGRVAAVETFAEDKQNDKYPNVPSYVPMTTSFVDLSSLETTKSVDGWMPDWCQ
jgi:hypothetical protein